MQNIYDHWRNTICLMRKIFIYLMSITFFTRESQLVANYLYFLHGDMTFNRIATLKKITQQSSLKRMSKRCLV